MHLHIRTIQFRWQHHAKHRTHALRKANTLGLHRRFKLVKCCWQCHPKHSVQQSSWRQLFQTSFTDGRDVVGQKRICKDFYFENFFAWWSVNHRSTHPVQESVTVAFLPMKPVWQGWLSLFLQKKAVILAVRPDCFFLWRNDKPIAMSLWFSTSN